MSMSVVVADRDRAFRGNCVAWWAGLMKLSCGIVMAWDDFCAYIGRHGSLQLYLKSAWNIVCICFNVVNVLTCT